MKIKIGIFIPKINLILVNELYYFTKMKGMNMLSRKYYCMIANCIKESKNIEQLIDKMCREFRCDNWNFDEGKFRRACGEEL